MDETQPISIPIQVGVLAMAEQWDTPLSSSLEFHRGNNKPSQIPISRPLQRRGAQGFTSDERRE